MLLSTTAKIKWNSRIKKHYVNLGYKFTKMGDEFEVDINHLTKGSKAIVEMKCDGEDCDEITTDKYQNYLRCVRDDGKTYCKKCANKLEEKIKKRNKTIIKNGKSFEDLCIELGRQDLLDRWDTEKNGCLPSEVSYSSAIPRWFKCDNPKYSNHHSELKSLARFSQGHDKIMDCIQCNSVAQSVVDMYDEEYLWKIWNKELNGNLNPWEISSCSHIEVWWNCPDDKHPPFKRSCDSSKFCKYRCPDCFEYPKGEQHYNYNPSLSNEERENGRNYSEYTQFIKDVMKRDNYTCQITGIISNGHNLVVHHINGYNWDKENRTNPDNGIVLCKQIHNLFHRLYGKGDNTKEQFNEFLELIENGEIDISNIN